MVLSPGVAGITLLRASGFFNRSCTTSKSMKTDADTWNGRLGYECGLQSGSVDRFMIMIQELLAPLQYPDQFSLW